MKAQSGSQVLAMIALAAALSPLSRAQQAQESSHQASDENSKPCELHFSQGATCIYVDQKDSGGMLVHKVEPAYPPLARQAHVQGTVGLAALIDKHGNAERLEVISGHPMLVPAAMDAVKQWKYKPYNYQGKRVGFETAIWVNFQLQ